VISAREHHVTWHCVQLASSEHCVFIEDDDGFTFRGVVVAPLALEPCHIDYAVLVDRRWRPHHVRATIVTPARRREIELRRHDGGGWDLDGATATHLATCDDVDLGWSPATNTIPIRRLGLRVGESATVTAAWIRFPELDVVNNEQRYTRLGTDHWRYQAGEYEFELVTDAGTGLVLAYGDDLWRASATSSP
jgi:hypothetical protein